MAYQPSFRRGGSLAGPVGRPRQFSVGGGWRACPEADRRRCGLDRGDLRRLRRDAGTPLDLLAVPGGAGLVCPRLPGRRLRPRAAPGRLPIAMILVRDVRVVAAGAPDRTAASASAFGPFSLAGGATQVQPSAGGESYDIALSTAGIQIVGWIAQVLDPLPPHRPRPLYPLSPESMSRRPRSTVTGRPDRLIKTEGTIIVEEWKSARTLRPWHRAQMGVYFLLVEEELRIRPSHGFVVLGDGSRHHIDNTEDLRAWVLDLAGQIRAARAAVTKSIPVDPSPVSAVRAG